MAYEGGYQTQQRPYPGPQHPRPGPPGPARGPAQYPPQQQPQYDDYQGDPGYDYYDDGSGYGPGYGEQYQDPGYARGPPPNQQYPPQRQDYRGPPQPNGPGRGGPPPMGGGQLGPGGPLQRAQTMDPTRNGPYPPRGGQPPGPGRGYPNGPPGRGGGPPGGYGRGPPPNMGGQGRPPMNGGPVNGQFPGNAPQQYPPQDQMRGGGYNGEAQLSNQMAHMDISQRPGMPPSRHSGGSQRSGGMQPPDAHAGYEAGPGGSDFGPPSRSMTTPANNPMMGQQRQPMPLPQRMDSMQSGPGPNRGTPGPQRPSTGHGHRPPPQRFYPNSQEPPLPQGGYPGPEYGNGPQGPPQAMRQQSRGSYDDIFDSYVEPTRFSNNAVPNFDNIPQRVPRESVDLHLNSSPSLANSGNRTKSQPDLRGSQNSVFEMAGDAPPMPSLPPGGQFGGGRGAPGQPMPMRGPGAPGLPGLPGHPGPRGPNGAMPPNPSAPQPSNNPDALPSHPTPVRPGLMADSVVNVSSNSMPVRTYGNQPPAPMMQAGVGPPPSIAPSRPPKDPVTAQELERLRAIFKADANDHETGLKYAKMLVEAADVLTPHIPDPRAKSRAREKYLTDAHKVLKKLAHGSSKDGMFFFADCIGRGLFGSEPDHKEAFTLYQSSAKLGHAGAAYRTAVCCEIGHEDGGGTRKDPLKAIQWYKRSATLGDTPAMYKMGMIQLKGLLGQPRNPREAIGWLKRAADQSDAENPHSLHELGLLYESAGGDDVIIRDEKYAFSLFKKAAELGYKFSQFRMGCAYEYGLMGCPIDPRLSIMWYSKAAVQQEHQAELALSGWYLTGSEGVLAQSDSEAYLWARKAATAGLAKAEYAMGYFTEVGIGTAANMDDAKRWYWRAAAQDLLKARERLEDLKRTGKSGPRQRERISRSKQQEGECAVM